MKKLLLFSLLTALFVFTVSTEAQAQRRGKKKTSKTDEYFDDSGAWAQNLWYGAGGVLGYQGGNNFSVFSIGISPMVGYKVTPWLSAGPRFSVVYTGYRGSAINVDRNLNEVSNVIFGPFKVNSTSFGVGAFARAKFLQSFFVQAEIENYTSNLPLGRGTAFYRDEDTLEFLKFKENRLNGYFGGGYNSSGGGLVGYEILLLYNFLLPDDSFDSPLEIRAGLTYNF